jgi:hypothetical protein
MTKTEIVYEMKGFSEQQRSEKAAAILKRALNPDAIIFELPKEEMDADSVVEEIVSQIGEIAGYTNLNLYNLKAKNTMLEIVFEETEDVQMALSTGVNLNGTTYLGTPSVDEDRKPTIRVNLSHIPLKLNQYLGEALSRFFGEAAVILDRKEENQKDYEELSRMIYLESQDIFIPATYIGAPKICFHCRLAGHVRNDCPELAAIQCHKCNGYGHFRRYCKSKPIEDDFNKELLEYERAQRQQDLQDQITEEMTKTAEEMTFDKYQEEQTAQQVDELMTEELEAATYK